MTHLSLPHAHSVLARSFTASLAASLASCLSAPARRSICAGDTIGAAAIAHSGATDAWDVLKRLRPRFKIEERWNGEPARVEARRGRSSIVLPNSDVPVLVLDGLRYTDLGMLREVPARSILSIRILSGIEGTMYQGTSAGAGVIIIATMSAPSDVQRAALDACESPVREPGLRHVALHTMLVAG